MSITILGYCEKCGQDKPVHIEAYPGVSSPSDKIMVQVVAKCVECESDVDYTWCALDELSPDWSEYEEARKAAGL